MKHYITLFLFVFTSIVTYGQNKNETKSVKKSESINETEDFMNQFLADFTFTPNVKESSKNTMILECMSFPEDFSSDEIEFLRKELKNDYRKKWSLETLPSVKIIQDKVIEQKDKNKFIIGEQNLFVFSHPIFLRNGEYCVIYEEIICGGRCGEGTLWLFVKDGIKWKKKERLCDWIH